MAGKSARPILITVIGAIFAIAGILYLIGGVCVLAGMGIESAVEGEPVVVGAAYVISALIYLVISIGLLKGWKVMWYLGMIIEAIGAISYLYMALTGQATMIIGTIIDLLIIIYLMRPGVKSYFLD